MKLSRLQILCPGGVVEPGVLEEAARAVHHAGAEFMRIGPRQSLFVDLPGERALESVAARLGKRFVAPPDYPNIMSTALVNESERSFGWLNEGVYLDVLDTLRLVGSRVSVSLCEPSGSSAYAGRSRLKFFASELRHHWNLVVDTIPAPFLVPSYLIHAVVEYASEIQENEPPVFFAALAERFEESLPAGEFGAPSTAPASRDEGLVEDADGLLRFDFFNESLEYPVLLLDELAHLCRASGIGRIHLSAWHSIRVNNIPLSLRRDWNRFIGRHGLNLRHDAAASGWRVLELNAENLELRRRLIQSLRERDTGARHLSFSLGQDFEMEGSALAIAPTSVGRARTLLGIRYYSLYYKRDYHSGPGAWKKFAGPLRGPQLGDAFARLCRRYYEQTLIQAEESAPGPTGGSSFPDARILRRCPDCFTVYDPRFGDSRNGIPAGTEFEELPESYGCSVCESVPAARFELVSISD